MAADPFFPGDELKDDPNLQSPRDEVHQAAPVVSRDMEGVVTGHKPDHYVHLANGAVVAGCSGGTHFDDAERGLIPIVSVYPRG